MAFFFLSFCSLLLGTGRETDQGFFLGGWGLCGTGSELFWQLSTEEAKTSPRFRTGLISSLNLVPEENAESSSAPEYMLVIDTQVFVDLEVYTFPFNKMPASMIEKPGNRLVF